MNWMVAESAMFHGGGGGCEEAEAEAEAAAYAEHLRRQAASKEKKPPEHAGPSAAMAAEHERMRAREQQRKAERVDKERAENVLSAALVGEAYRLPPEVSGHILQGVGKPSGTRTFEYAGTQQARTEAEHARRQQLRAGVVAFEKRVDGYTNELAGGSSGKPEARWAELPTVTAQEAKDLVGKGNSMLHATEDKQFVQMFVPRS